MIIKKIAFGNAEEAFIEDRFGKGTSIIFSNDNNRGKTLLMQAIAHSIGYESIFPSGFDHKQYYFYSHMEFDGDSYEFLRRRNSIIVLHQGDVSICGTISEFKHYFDKEISPLPRIEKDGVLRIADLNLLYEIFFLGQDKRNTSNIIIRGLNNKADFMSLLYSLKGVSTDAASNVTTQELVSEKKKLEGRIKTEIRKLTVLKTIPDIATFVSSSANNVEFKRQSARLQEVNVRIAEIQKQRGREQNRKFKLEGLKSELLSLNRNLDEGQVKCADCGSDRIMFTNDDFEFEVSNRFVRDKILTSIDESIKIKSEIINELNQEIQKEHLVINSLIETTTPESRNYLLFHDEIVDSRELDKTILGLQNDLERIDSRLENLKIKSNLDLQLRKEIEQAILNEMKRYYSIIDPGGLLNFESLFTKAGETYSGSEEQEYYFCKMLALNNILEHKFPILIDSFREGELSSTKEDLMLREFRRLKKQVILTSTLKTEEYSSEKYYGIKNLTVIDYSEVQDSKLLQRRFVPQFIELLERFNVTVIS